MAYFDSSKNRALWEIELQGLKKQRADRQAGKTSGEIRRETVKVKTGKEPVKMSYADLLKEEAASAKRSPKRERTVQMEKQRERQREQQKEQEKRKNAEKGRAL